MLVLGIFNRGIFVIHSLPGQGMAILAERFPQLILDLVLRAASIKIGLYHLRSLCLMLFLEVLTNERFSISFPGLSTFSNVGVATERIASLDVIGQTRCLLIPLENWWAIMNHKQWCCNVLLLLLETELSCIFCLFVYQYDNWGYICKQMLSDLVIRKQVLWPYPSIVLEYILCSTPWATVTDESLLRLWLNYFHHDCSMFPIRKLWLEPFVFTACLPACVGRSGVVVAPSCLAKTFLPT